MRASTPWFDNSAVPSALAYCASILVRTSSKVGTSWPTVWESVAIAVLSCSCIRAWSSCERSFWRSLSFCCSRLAFCWTAALACWAAWVDCRRHRLQVVHPLFGHDQPVGERFGGLVVLSRFRCVAPAGGVVCHRQGLPGRGADLLQLLHGTVELQLGLFLVGDHTGRLLYQSPVLLLGLCHGLLQLHLRVGVLLEPAGQLGHQVVPPAFYNFPHASYARASEGIGVRRARFPDWQPKVAALTAGPN